MRGPKPRKALLSKVFAVVLVLAVAVVLVCFPLIKALAYSAKIAPSLNLNQPGSISLSLTDSKGTPALVGSEIALWHIGSIHKEISGKLSFELVSDFYASGVNVDNLEEASSNTGAAQVLFEWAQENAISALSTQMVSGNGSVSFDGIKPGLYLVACSKVSQGWQPVAPFVISVPLLVNGVYDYNVDATPKVAHANPVADVPDNPTNPDNPTTPDTPDNPNPSNKQDNSNTPEDANSLDTPASGGLVDNFIALLANTGDKASIFVFVIALACIIAVAATVVEGILRKRRGR